MSASSDMDETLADGFRSDASTSKQSLDSIQDDTMTSDEAICRVCRSGREDGPLFHPCKCTGSIRFVHEQCLSDWLSVRKASTPKCELCNTPIRYQKIFSEGMPTELPPGLLAKRSLIALLNVTAFICRAVLVAFIWLAVLPFDTYWLFRLYIWGAEGVAHLVRVICMRPLPEERQRLMAAAKQAADLAIHELLAALPSNGTCANRQGWLLPRPSWHDRRQEGEWWHQLFNTIVSETFQGQIITSCIVVIFVAGFLLREWIMMNAPLPDGAPPAEAPAPAPRIQPANQAEQRRQALLNAIRALPHDLQVRLEPRFADRIREMEQEDIIQPDRLEVLEQAHALLRELIGEGLAPAPPAEPRDNGADGAPALAPLFQDPTFGLDTEQGWDAPPVEPDPAPVGLPFLDEERNAIAMQRAEPLPQPAAPFIAPAAGDGLAGAGLEEPLFLEDDLDGILEAVGMKGSLLVLIQNMGLMNLLVAICLLAAFYVPLSIGKVLAAANFFKLVTVPVRGVRSITDPTFDFVFHGAVWFGKRATARLVSGSLLQPLLAQLDRFKPAQDVTQSAPATTALLHAYKARLAVAFNDLQTYWIRMGTQDDSGLRVACTVAGYLFVLAAGGVYLQCTRSAYGATVHRALRDGVKQQLVLFKVAAFMIIELLVFPSMCGLLLQLCTLPLFANATIQDRIALYHAKPFTMLFLTWLPGSLYMFVFSVAVDGVRDSVRNGLCWWLRDPTAAEFHPIREILERNSLTQARKIATSAMLYAFTIFAIFGVSSAFLRYALLGVLPLRLDYGRTFSAPLDFLAYRYVLPFVIDQLQPKSKLCSAFVTVAERSAHELRLSHFVFGTRDKSEEGSHSRRSWRAWLTLKKAKFVEVDGKYQDENSAGTHHQDVLFRPDGSWGRVPAIDNVRVVPGRKMVVPVTEDGKPVDDTAAAVIKQQEHEMETTRKNDKYEVVYLPPAWKVRLCLFIYSLWFIGMIVGMFLTVVPLQLGRFVLGRFGLAPHDTYSLVLGITIFTCIASLSHIIDRIRDQPRLTLASAFTSAALASVALVTCIIIPLLFGFLAHSYFAFPFEWWHHNKDSTHAVELVFPVLTGWSIGLVLFDCLSMMSSGFFSRFMPSSITNIAHVTTLHQEGEHAEAVELLIKRTVFPLLAHLGTRVSFVLAFDGLREVLPRAIVIPPGSSGAILLAVDVLWLSLSTGRKRYKVWKIQLREEEFLVSKRLLNFEETATS